MTLTPTLNVPVYRSERFTYVRESNEWVAEASDLGCRAGQAPWARCYDDACDQGFYIESVRTDRKVLFVLAQEHRSEGEVTHWTLKPADRDLWAAGTVTIFND
jgi:hypothetical protein